MKKFFCEISQSIFYVKKELIFSLILYLLGVALGIFLFKDKSVEINPQNLGIAIIWINNMKVGILIFILSLFTLGIGGSILLLINGGILGGAIMGVYNMYSIQPIITGILPHMLFEIIGLLFFSSVSYETLKLLLNVVTKRKSRKVYIKKDLIVLSLGLIFLTLAAIIEGGISHA